MWRKIVAGIVGALMIAAVVAVLGIVIDKQRETIRRQAAMLDKAAAELTAARELTAKWQETARKYETIQPTAADELSSAAIDDFNRLFGALNSGVQDG